MYEYFKDFYKQFKDTNEYKNFMKNILCIKEASKLKIAVCGSTGLQLAGKNPSKIPNDLDFVTNSNEYALLFISNIIKKFEKYKWYGRIYIQHKTNFCLNNTVCHYKIKNSFGLNICVMVLSKSIEYNYWFNKKGICIQKYNDIKGYADEAEKKDKKDRTTYIQPIDKQEDDIEDWDCTLNSKTFKGLSQL